jgi:two-component system, OmpR family, response regulator
MSKAKHILVVEPTEDVREVLIRMLESRGYRATAADSGEAMRHLLAEPDRVDAIVLDTPRSGETAASLARHAKHLRVPLVMISGHPTDMEFAAVHGLQLLKKPIRTEELLVAVDEAFASGEFGQRNA